MSLQTKLTDHEDSLAWLASMQEEVVKIQHMGDMRVQSVRFLPEALIVLEALHEAARDVIGEVDDEVVGEESGVAAAIWPAIAKFVGECHSALLSSNVVSRNALWRIGGMPAEHVDCEARLLDALSASAKLMVHLAAQAYCEKLMQETEAEEESEEVAEATEDGGGEGTLVVGFQDRCNLVLVANKILSSFRQHLGGLELLREGPVLGKFQNGRHPLLRKVRDALSTSAVVWKNGIDLLVQEEVLEAAQEDGRVL